MDLEQKPCDLLKFFGQVLHPFMRKVFKKRILVTYHSIIKAVYMKNAMPPLS